MLALTLCGSLASAAEPPVSVGYIPIMPMAQLFVMSHEGWTKKAGLNLKFIRFSSGPAMVQALASGKLDVAYIGIGPAMVARAHGVPLQVVAANVTNQIALIARGALAKQMTKTPGAAGIRAFTKASGHKPRIATLPSGSVPDSVLRYWLVKRLNVKPDAVDIKSMGASSVQQSLLSGAVDAASIMEPILTIVRSRVPSAKVIARGDEMLPDQPGAVVAVRTSLIKAHPEIVQKLVDLHVKATRLLTSDPGRAADDLEAFVGRGLISTSLLEKALRSPSTHFIADPHKILPSTRILAKFQREQGLSTKHPDLDALFNNTFYEHAIQTQGNH